MILGIEETALALQQCLCDALAEAAADPSSMVRPVCLCSVISGDSVPLDYCGPGSCGGDSCGMAWVRLAGAVALAEETLPGCAQPMQARFEVGIARCSLTMIGDTSRLPDAEAHMRETLTMMDDLKVMRKAIGCCAGADRIRIEEYVPFGPEGGCIGGAFSIVADVR